MADWKEEYDNLLLGKTTDMEALFSLKTNNFPQAIYKYRSFDINGYWKDWLNGTIFATRPSSFNDPFDCVLNSERGTNTAILCQTMITEAASYGVILTPIEVNGLLATDDPMAAYISFMKTKGKEVYFDTTEKLYNLAYHTALLQSYLRVASFCTEYSSILMWSHYANNHEGFCVQYDFSSCGFAKSHIFPVAYSNKRAVITPDTLSCDTWPIYAALIKSSQWSYEKEWRFLSGENIAKLFCFLDTPCVQQYQGIPVPVVCLGARCDLSSDNVKELLKIAEKNGTKVYKMKPHPTEFSVFPELIYAPTQS